MTPSTEPFSFHCTICYESLNTTDRAPVVLPCGHTFLCEPCAKRLDKCMECRTPLSTAAPPRSPQPPGPLDRSGAACLQRKSATSRSTFRSNYSARSSIVAPWQVNTPSPPPLRPPVVVAEEAPERIRLPIPRNQVLMSLIGSVQESTNDNEKDVHESGDDDGLVREWSCIGNFFNMVEAPMSELKRLVYNQKDELVSFGECVAVVGGGAGYITVDNRAQLVKVGEAKEEICKFESEHAGLLEQLKKLERKKKKIERAESAMAQKIKETLAEMENMDSCFVPEPRWGKLPEEETVETSEQSLVRERLSPESPVSVRDAPPCEDGKVDLSPATEQTEFVGLSEPHKSLEKELGGNFDPFFSGHRDRGVSHRSKDIDFATGLSGHRGLNRSQTPKYPTRPERFIRMMGEHKGVTVGH